ncbi:adenosylcobinamide-GDP ribazoletransferase [Corynebacterium diphtheriae]|uniref:Adenosylcobinamide-GDP ribazoletransferase n=1 Tax=Corynebacterium diphtheriae bv. gravis TaxID=1720349 RepID=A0AAX0J309_CORDP|nr:adenosylcobinamide-GDP ribazoletransferase [Corynebacterium diphtheriae]ERA53636.1 cobalamin synthase [Corynebacterium diphtheriae DSM 43988]OWN09870.1 adenosylcobinamide-GDP ribazoletransferase [Corynebacterium belfantii]AEX67825.1 cobalamin synthase [Corynebacterium diphtheriae C7 (beta)]AEX70276.1 cobalamin synthase [Corynebacterium diphtheriae PW8]KLN38702.1 cobalamin synthase [Corynebacterium diphtheriae bv. gravis str. ISS 4060]
MSGKAYFVNGEHGPAIIEGPLTALNWLTILPVPSATAFDRVTGGRVMASVPFIGIVLGIVGGAIAFAATSLGVASIVAATSIVCFWELFTRFMHLDGLADVSDALGSYAPPARAREIIADPATGLIGMGACLISILIHISSFTALLDAHLWWMVMITPMIGRFCAIFGAHSRLKPMNPTGFGAMLIGTVKTHTIIAWLCVLLVICIGVPLVMDRGELITITILGLLCSVTLALVEIHHLHRRFEGMNGDTTGFIMHSATALCALVFAVGVGIVA